MVNIGTVSMILDTLSCLFKSQFFIHITLEPLHTDLFLFPKTDVYSYLTRNQANCVSGTSSHKKYGYQHCSAKYVLSKLLYFSRVRLIFLTYFIWIFEIIYSMLQTLALHKTRVKQTKKTNKQ